MFGNRQFLEILQLYGKNLLKYLDVKYFTKKWLLLSVFSSNHS